MGIAFIKKWNGMDDEGWISTSRADIVCMVYEELPARARDGGFVGLFGKTYLVPRLGKTECFNVWYRSIFKVM